MKNAGHGRGGFGQNRGGFASNGAAFPSPMQQQQQQHGNVPQQSQNFAQNTMYNVTGVPSYYAHPSGGYPNPLQTPYALPTFQQFAQQTQQGGYNTQHNQNNKRPHPNASNNPRSNLPRPPAAPAVPSFGAPLPVKPPTPLDSTSQPVIKRRKFNQLGLTPKTDGPESSEEDDADEEAKLVAKVPSEGLQVTYRGRTSALQSGDDIAKWIEERRKRFPTVARADQAKKEADAKRAEREVIRKQKEAARDEGRRLAREAREKNQKEKRELKKGDAAPGDAVAKAKSRAEKLRKKLMKEEMKLAKVEANAEKARLSSKNDDKPQSVEDKPEGAETTLGISPPEPRSTQGSDDFVTRGLDCIAGALDAKPLETGLQEDKLNKQGMEANSMGPSGLSDDETSSSGSDASSDDSDSDSDSDSDAAPEEATSKRTKPDRVAPPPRVEPGKSKQTCHKFAKTGRCNKGDECRYSHEKREGQPGPTKKAVVLPERRKSLFQAVGRPFHGQFWTFHLLTFLPTASWSTEGRRRPAGHGGHRLPGREGSFG